MKICITGGIACGKSLVGGFLAGHGVPVRDADDVCRELTEPGGALHGKIASAFGREILGAHGGIDRRALAGLVLSDRSKRERLNAIIHPVARRELESWISQQGAGYVAAIIPLVFEAGWEQSWHRIVCVSAPVALQIERLAKRGLSEDEARAWIKIQMPVEEKMRRADYVIFNSGTLECAKAQTLKLIEDIESEICDEQHAEK